MSGAFVFTDIGDDHGQGPAFDPVVRFMNAHRAQPRGVADRVFLSCGVYEERCAVVIGLGLRKLYDEWGSALQRLADPAVPVDRPHEDPDRADEHHHGADGVEVRDEQAQETDADPEQHDGGRE
jgi:hypothetical protein